MAFTFGDAVPVLNGNELSDYMESWFNGRWYEPQVSMSGLAKSYKSTPYLNSGIIFKRNFLANLFIPHAKLNRKGFEQVALDYVWCGNTYLEEIKSRLGSVIQYKPALAKYMRRGEYSDQFFYFVMTIKAIKNLNFIIVFVTFGKQTLIRKFMEHLNTYLLCKVHG